MDNVKDIRAMFRELKRATPAADMIEILGASFIADEESIFGEVNKDYVEKEIEWYMSQSRNVNDLEDTPKIWKEIADEDGMINSNYGWCIHSITNGMQYGNVIKELRANPNSRRGVMIYTRPSMHSDATLGGKNDFICTNAVNYMLRDGKLNCIVQMRSNDVVFGYKNDYAWQKYVLDSLAKELGVMPGTIVWQVASLHIYPRHRYLID